MARERKYFKRSSDAKKALEERKRYKTDTTLGIYKMPKGTRHHGEFAVCTYMEFINTY